jgi:hypothetical protein
VEGERRRASQLMMRFLGIGVLFEKEEGVEVEDDRCVGCEVGVCPEFFNVAAGAGVVVFVGCFVVGCEEFLEDGSVAFFVLEIVDCFLRLLELGGSEEGFDCGEEFGEGCFEGRNGEARESALVLVGAAVCTFWIGRVHEDFV